MINISFFMIVNYILIIKLFYKGTDTKSKKKKRLSFFYFCQHFFIASVILDKLLLSEIPEKRLNDKGAFRSRR